MLASWVAHQPWSERAGQAAVVVFLYRTDAVPVLFWAVFEDDTSLRTLFAAFAFAILLGIISAIWHWVVRRGVEAIGRLFKPPFTPLEVPCSPTVHTFFFPGTGHDGSGGDSPSSTEIKRQYRHYSAIATPESPTSVPVARNLLKPKDKRVRDRPYHLQTQLDWVKATMAMYPTPQHRFVIMGVGEGACLALKLAHHLSEFEAQRVAALVLESPISGPSMQRTRVAGTGLLQSLWFAWKRWRSARRHPPLYVNEVLRAPTSGEVAARWFAHDHMRVLVVTSEKDKCVSAREGGVLVAAFSLPSRPRAMKWVQHVALQHSAHMRFGQDDARDRALYVNAVTAAVFPVE